jgi:hypothetical protein
VDFRKIKGVKHFIFENVEEFELFFKDKGLEVPLLAPDWREAVEGDWVVADDGGVVQVLRQGPMTHPHDRKNYKLSKGWCRTVVGSFIQADKVEMDTDLSLHSNRYRFSGKSNKQALEHIKNREWLSKNERIFVTALLSGKTLQQAYEEAYGPHFDWRDRAVGILKRKRIVEKLNRNLDEIAVKLGLDFEYIFSKLKDIVEGSSRDNVKLSALREISALLTMKDKIKQIQQGQIHVFSPFDSKKLASIEAEKVDMLERVGGENE